MDTAESEQQFLIRYHRRHSMNSSDGASHHAAIEGNIKHAIGMAGHSLTIIALIESYEEHKRLSDENGDGSAVPEYTEMLLAPLYESLRVMSRIWEKELK